MKKRTLALMMALNLLIGCVAGVTLAWMTAETEEKTNTFTLGDIDIDLVEHEYDEEATDEITDVEVADENEYPLLPGTVYAKDPTVSVAEGSEDCYLFVEVVKTNDPDTYLDYELNLIGWTELEDGVYYREVAKADIEREWNLIKDDKVTVKDTIVDPDTNESDLNSNEVVMPEVEPSLSFKAYACQKANIATAAEAWAIVNP